MFSSGKTDMRFVRGDVGDPVAGEGRHRPCPFCRAAGSTAGIALYRYGGAQGVTVGVVGGDVQPESRSVVLTDEYDLAPRQRDLQKSRAFRDARAIDSKGCAR